MESPQHTAAGDKCADFLLYTIGSCILDDEAWRAFGFRRRLHRASMWNFLVSKERIAYESFVIHELTLVALVATVRSLGHRADEGKASPAEARGRAGGILARVLFWMTCDAEWRHMLRFSSCEDALHYYSTEGPELLVRCRDDWPRLIHQRAPRMSCKRYKAGALVGSCWITGRHSTFGYASRAQDQILQQCGLPAPIWLPDHSYREALVEAAVSLMYCQIPTGPGDQNP